MEHSKPFAWAHKCEEAFDKLKQCLSTPPMLVFPNFSREFLLDTDASDQAIGAVLSQTQNDSQENFSVYVSREEIFSHPYRVVGCCSVSELF